MIHCVLLKSFLFIPLKSVVFLRAVSICMALETVWEETQELSWHLIYELFIPLPPFLTYISIADFPNPKELKLFLWRSFLSYFFIYHYITLK